MNPYPIHWIAPVTRRNTLEWLDPCQGDVVTPTVLKWRKVRGLPAVCSHRAKVDFRGKKLCVRHARMSALRELAGDMPNFELSVSAKGDVCESRSL